MTEEEELYQLCRDGTDEEALRYLETHPTVNVNYCAPSGSCPLYKACRRSLVKTANLLLDRHVEVNVYSAEHKRTPLMAACIRAEPNSEEEKLAVRLLDLGAKSKVLSVDYGSSAFGAALCASDKLAYLMLRKDFDFWLAVEEERIKHERSPDTEEDPPEKIPILISEELGYPCLLCQTYRAKKEQTTLFVLEQFITRGYTDRISKFLPLLDNNYQTGWWSWDGSHEVQRSLVLFQVVDRVRKLYWEYLKEADTPLIKELLGIVVIYLI